ncbi:MAG TPA: nuclear transport factor 2 family protein [Candidatus Dormibacteraeota bacterium]|nr:nuclear transport factor 2 family protein [Candidatus Dormibacteraeota bacterium]
MGMRSGKALKVKKAAARKVVRKKVVGKKAAPKKAAVKRVVAKAAPAPKVRTKVVTRTVTVDKNAALRALAQRIVDLTVANRDEETLALYADNVESREASNPPMIGIDAIREKFKMWRSMVTDAAFLPRTVLADGNTIVIEWDGRVTLAASGRVAELNEVAVHEIENGKIVRERFYYDPAVLQQ